VNIYLAGSYSARKKLADIAMKITQRGHDMHVPAIWLTGKHDDAAPVECATADLQDIKNADMLVLFTEYPGSRGGMYVELGIALAHRIPVIIVGPYTNVFTRLCRRIDSVDEFLDERSK